MKKGILKVFGVAALAAGMLYNMQVLDSENNSDISLAALKNSAVAKSEFPWPLEPPPVGKLPNLDPCKLDLGNGWFTSSVKIVCYEVPPCITCTCTEVACGEV